MSLVIWTCQNDLGLSLCVVPSTSHVDTISEDGLVRSLWTFVSCPSSSFVIKSVEMCVHGFSDTSLGLSFSVGFSVWSLFLQQILHLFRYCFTFLITFSHQKFLVISPIIFYCSIISVLQYKKIISVLNLSFFGTYISELKKMDLVFILSFIFILFYFIFHFLD